MDEEVDTADSVAVVLDVTELGPILSYTVLCFRLVAVTDELSVVSSDENILIVAGIETQRVSNNGSEDLVDMGNAGVERYTVCGRLLGEV